jgi:peptidoglycan/xylan/chitin deacetylase (PgdA/CDA1 family)
VKALVRDLATAALQCLPRVPSVASRHDRLFIATFHRILPDEQGRAYPLPSLTVTPSQFEWFVRFFLERFHCQRLDQAWSAFVAGEKSSKPRLAITFDDGQLDNFLHAAPVLGRLGVPGTFFVPVEAVETQSLLWHDRMGYAIMALGRTEPNSELLLELGVTADQARVNPRIGVVKAKDWTSFKRTDWIHRAELKVPDSIPAWDGMMNWAQVRQLSQLGHEIGSHSYSHPLLDHCSDAELVREISDSRQEIEQKIGCGLRSFCYPNGNTSNVVGAAVKQSGYSLAVTTQWGSNKRNEQPYALKRHDMVTSNSIDRHGNLSSRRVEQRMLDFVWGAS